MRHRVKGRKLNRTSSHRLATLISLSTSLIKHKKIRTTVAKAKEARSFVEPLITKAKQDSVHARRYVSRFIKDKDAVKELFGEISEKIEGRPGGYTRIVKLGHRRGDAAEMAILELVDYNVIAPQKKDKSKVKEEVEVVESAEVVGAVTEEVKEADIVEAEVVEEKPKKKKSKTTKAKTKKEEVEKPKSKKAPSKKKEVKEEKETKTAKSKSTSTKKSEDKTEDKPKKTTKGKKAPKESYSKNKKEDK